MNKHLQRFLNEKVAVRLRTQDEWNQFMEILERETDAGWWDARPTQLNFWKNQKEMTSIVYGFGGGNFLGYSRYGFFENEGYEIIEFKDLLKEEKSMTIAEKLRFLADRIEDGKEFYIGQWLVKYQNEVLMEPWDSNKKDSKFMKSRLMMDTVINYDLKPKPQWEFTEDEKVILRNLPEEYQWIARDITNNLFVYDIKPYKSINYWSSPGGYTSSIVLFNDIFQYIQWLDEEPCEFRKYL